MITSLKRAAAAIGCASVVALSSTVLAPTAIATVSAQKAPTVAATSCSGTRDGSRDAATEVADTGFVEHDVVHSDGSLSSAEITLRYSASTQCAWGLLETSNSPGGSIWIERSSPWDGNTQRLGQRNLSEPSITHTGAYDARQGSIRACGYGYNGTNNARVGVEGYIPSAEAEQEFSRAEVACTEWVAADTLVPTY